MNKPENKTPDEALKKKLKPLQYEVTQCSGTEPPFKNEYWDNKEEGIYVDIVSGEPLFSSEHKYDSGTGWPSFYQPLEPDHLEEKPDHTLARTRTEVRSKKSDSHLGHVFDDGPKPTGKRYCMNSAALRFIPKEKLVEEGYGQYADRFKDQTGEQVAYFAGGCFWCSEADFLKLRGVKSVESGYMGGQEKDPSYEQVSSGTTEHAETVKVTFDPKQISYADLLKVFWMSIDPTVRDRQFCDIGHQYRSAIFYTDDEQRRSIEKSLAWLKEKFPDMHVLTEVSEAKQFYKAEGHHQRYFEKNPIRYKFYRFSSGRDQRLDELFGKEREEIARSFKK